MQYSSKMLVGACQNSVNKPESLKGDHHTEVLAVFAATTKTTAVGGHMKTRDFSQRDTLLMHSTVKSFSEFCLENMIKYMIATHTVQY